MIGKTISHYRIIEKLGEGGMGVVYKAEDTRLDRTVALKFLTQQALGGEEDRARFVHEAKSAAALPHPNICTVYEIDEAEGRTFIAMEYVQGRSLKDKIESGPLRLDAAVGLAIQVAEGLQEAHEKGIVHRDIKPANVMITAKGQVKIMDFGLAKSAKGAALTQTGTTLGTIAYMSPEQTRGETVDGRTDIWSVGAILYEMITGQRPFKGDYEQAVVYSILNATPEPVTALRTGVPMELERVIERCLEKDAAERYQTSADLVSDMRRVRKVIADGPGPSAEAGALRAEGVAAGQPVGTAPVGHAAPVKKAASRGRLWLWGAGTAAGLAVVVVAVLLVAKAGLFGGPSDEVMDSIAVLPLENLSDDPSQEYFADAMTEALITELSKIKALRVISRTSAMQYKEDRKPLPEIARELNVKAVVEGSALVVGDKIRITAQLIEARTDRHIWAESYDRDLRDVLALQKEVATEIARQVRVTLTPTEQADFAEAQQVDPEAYQAYVRGRHFWNKTGEEGLRESIPYFRAAIDEDPDYALAYVGLADAYALLGFNGHMPADETTPEARAAVLKALEIDDTLAEAHATLGLIFWLYDWDFDSAEKEFRRSLEINPGYVTARRWYGYLLAIRRQFDEAIDIVEEIPRLDPLALQANTVVSIVHYLAGQYDPALDLARRVLALDPKFNGPHWVIGAVYLERGDYDKAIEELELAADLQGSDPGSRATLALAYVRAGQHDRARKILNDLEAASKREFVPATSFAEIHAALGESDEAFRWLEKAYVERDSQLMLMNVVAAFDGVRSDPRFTELLKKIGLEE